MAVLVSATFKKDEQEFNGLEVIHDALIESPLDRRVIVAVVETIRVSKDIRAGGVETPTIRLVHVEAMTPDQAIVARKLLDAAYAARTGQAAPPPDLFEDGIEIDRGGPVAAEADQDAVEETAQADAVVEDPPWDEGEPAMNRHADAVDETGDAPLDVPPPAAFSDPPPAAAGNVTELVGAGGGRRGRR